MQRSTFTKKSQLKNPYRLMNFFSKTWSDEDSLELVVLVLLQSGGKDGKMETITACV